LAGTILQAEGSAFGGAAAMQTYNARAQIAKNNAQIARYNAALAAATGESRGEALGLRSRARIGAIKAGQAGAGLDVNTGSAVDVRASAAALDALDIMNAKAEAARAVYGYGLKASEEETEAKLMKRAGKYALVEGLLGAGQSALSGASSLQSRQAQWDLQAGTGKSGSVAQPFFTDDYGNPVE
jgi:hypothetical protein